LSRNRKFNESHPKPLKETGGFSLQYFMNQKIFRINRCTRVPAYLHKTTRPLKREKNPLLSPSDLFS
jgi:hypothetical protein